MPPPEVFNAARGGGLAALASNPFFILKTRFQSASNSAAAAVGEQHAVAGGVGSAFAAIYRSDGLGGYFRGLSAFAPRVMGKVRYSCLYPRPKDA